MSRKHRSIKRLVSPDPIYNDITVGKFMNIIMINGKKAVAEKIIYNAFKYIKSNIKEDPLKIFKQALEKTRPLVEVKSRRVGGTNYQVPVEVHSNRGLVLSFRWIKKAAEARAEKRMYIRIASELIDASKEKGEALKKKDQMHKMADANKAFAHYLW
jgi:small subunit ribosomal protein S7